MIIAEAAVVGLSASGTGCVLGALAIPVLRSWMTSHGVAPAWFSIPVTAPPLVIAVAVGVASALAGAIAESWRAARVPPGEALRDTASSSSVMTQSRWVLGLGLLAGGAYAGRAIITGSPANAMIVKDDMPALVLIVAGCALLAPVLLRPVARAVTGPLARAGAGPMVVRQNVLWAGRRTAAIAAPVVLALAWPSRCSLLKPAPAPPPRPLPSASGPPPCPASALTTRHRTGTIAAQAAHRTRRPAGVTGRTVQSAWVETGESAPVSAGW